MPYREFYARHPDFQARVRPMVRLGVTPILATPQGEVLQDSTAIIEFMEARIAGLTGNLIGEVADSERPDAAADERRLFCVQPD